MTTRTASSAAAVSARSTISCSSPAGGGRRSSTTGVAPDDAMRQATAAPRPDAPPVTTTVPTSLTTRLLDQLRTRAGDQARRRPALQVRHHDHRAAPAPQHLGLGDPPRAVVVALHEHVGPQALERAHRGRLVEDHHLVDALQTPQDRRAVALADEWSLRALQSPYRAIGVQEHHQ